MHDGEPDWSTTWRADVHRVAGQASLPELVRLVRGSRVFRPILTARLCRSAPLPPSVRGPAHLVLRRLHRLAQHQAGMDLPWETEIGIGLTIVHGWGLVVSPDARLGRNVTLFHGVTIGRKDTIAADGTRTVGGAPTIGDQVWIGPHALVVGDITIGEGSVIGGGSVVTKDVPPHSLVVGNPAQVIARDVAPDCPNPVVPAGPEDGR